MTFAKRKSEWVKAYFVRVLAESNGRTGEAARIAGMSVPNFLKYLRQLGLRAADFR